MLGHGGLVRLLVPASTGQVGLVGGDVVGLVSNRGGGSNQLAGCVADVSGANRWEGGHVVQNRPRYDATHPKKQTLPLLPNAVAANRPKYILPLLLGSKWPRAKGVYREK
jgi:hypothetical protein